MSNSYLSSLFQKFLITFLMVKKELSVETGNLEFEDTEIQFTFRNNLRFSIILGVAFLVLFLFFSLNRAFVYWIFS